VTQPDVLAVDGDLAIRRMREDPSDYASMLRWLSDPDVLHFTYGRDRTFTLAEVRTKYGARIRGESPATPCFITVDGRPVGYTQFYRWIDWPDDMAKMGLPHDELGYGMDIWIGEPALWNQGLGTRAIRALLAHLFDSRDAAWVALSTVTWNDRAIRCYEKAGFQNVNRLSGSEFRDGAFHDEWVMLARPSGR
jgi:aminoglycoside 6'-N-acetyltransferase